MGNAGQWKVRFVGSSADEDVAVDRVARQAARSRA